MANFSKHFSALAPVGLLIVASTVGCGLGAARVSAPEWNPSTLTDKAFTSFDADGDGQLSEKELKKSPGLNSALSHIDSNQDKKISRDELSNRFALYKDGKVALKQVTFRVLYKNRPLEDGIVKMIPEPFLDGLCEPAEGMIFEDGSTNPKIAGEKIPSMRLGFYRMEITSDKKKIPAKYNTETTLGLEVSPISDDADSYSVQTYNLK